MFRTKMPNSNNTGASRVQAEDRSQMKLEVIFAPIPIYNLPENRDIKFPITRKWKKKDPPGVTIIRQELKAFTGRDCMDPDSAPEKEDVVTEGHEDGGQDNAQGEGFHAHQ